MAKSPGLGPGVMRVRIPLPVFLIFFKKVLDKCRVIEYITV